MLEACCLLPTFTAARVTVVGQLHGSTVPEASPAAAGGQQGSNGAGLGGSSSAGPALCCDPAQDAAERACWEELVRQLSARAPQLLWLDWVWQGSEGTESIPPAAWSAVANSGAPRAARYMYYPAAVASTVGNGDWEEAEAYAEGEQDADEAEW